MPDTLKWFRWPVDDLERKITGHFGQVNGYGYAHRGTDVGVPIGTPVYAPAAGKVVPFVNDGGFGIAVCLDHPGTPWFSLYAHLSRSLVANGQAVVPGDLIGLSGNTGKSTGPHLHWQVCRSTTFPLDIRQSTDPLAIPFTSAASSTPGEFFSLLCQDLGWEPTPWRVECFKFWGGQESTGELFVQAYNPLATTQWSTDINTSFDNGNGPGNWNSVPVRVYRTLEGGVAATRKTLLNGYYPDILASFRDQVGYQAALDDFRTWVGSEAYGQRVIDYMNTTAADKGDDVGISAEQCQVMIEDTIAAKVRNSELIDAGQLPELVGQIVGPFPIGYTGPEDLALIQQIQDHLAGLGRGEADEDLVEVANALRLAADDLDPPGVD